MSKRIFALGAALVAFSFTLGACDDSSSTSPGDATLSIVLTDAPGGLAEAWVEITGIYLQGTTGPVGEKVWLLQGSTGLIDLLTLSDKTLELVSDAVVPPGVYAQMRLIVGGAVIVTDEGKVYATPGTEHPGGLAADGLLECPSCGETGFKVNLPGGAVMIEDDAMILVLDFDVSQTFGRGAGVSSQWVMEPVISASNFETSGTIAGTVALGAGVSLPTCGSVEVGLDDFVPVATSGAIEKSGDVNPDGTYKISFVEPGTYDMSYAATVEFDGGVTVIFEATHPAVVTVESGASAVADYTITAASCG
jgi:hypothetical protein